MKTDGTNMENTMTDETQDEAIALAEEPRLNFDPKEVEAILIKQAEERAQDPTETAATAYQMYVPHYKRALPKISTRGLRRIINYMVLYPLEQDSVKSASEFEKQVMQLVNSLVEAKFVMLMDSYRLNAEAMYAAENSPLTQEQKDEAVDTLRAGGVSEEEIERLKQENK